MRTDNLIIVMLGLASATFAVVAIVRWGALPVRPSVTSSGSDPGVVPGPADRQSTASRSPRVAALIDAAWSLAAVLSAAIVAGLAVGGILARVIMRVAGGLSPIEAQGRLTEAEEVVGEITLGGTFFLVVFVGLFGAVVALGLYLVSRPWLPATARGAGGLVGVLVLGIIGPDDPLDPDNFDFVLLSFDLVTVVLAIGSAVLFGMSFASLAVRFERAARGRSKARWLLGLGYLFVLFPPFAASALVYLGGRALFPGRLRAIVDRQPVQMIGRVLLTAAALTAASRLVIVAVEIA